MSTASSPPASPPSAADRARQAPLQAIFAVPALVFLLFVVLPIAALIYRAVEAGGVADRLNDDFVLEALQLSLWTSTVTLVIAVLLGTPVAYFLARVSFPGKRLVDTLLDLPIVLPPTVAGVALLVAFGRRGVFGQYLADLGVELAFTTTAVIMAQLFVAAPFLIRSLKAGFEAVDPAYEGVSATLGVSPLRTFWRVTLRLSWPSLLGGAVLCWSRALSELGATLIFAGSFSGRTETMPLAIISAFESSQGLTGALALSLILLVVAAVLLLGLRVLLRARAVYQL